MCVCVCVIVCDDDCSCVYMRMRVLCVCVANILRVCVRAVHIRVHDYVVKLCMLSLYVR